MSFFVDKRMYRMYSGSYEKLQRAQSTEEKSVLNKINKRLLGQMRRLFMMCIIKNHYFCSLNFSNKYGRIYFS
jgi:hypothetical protein